MNIVKRIFIGVSVAMIVWFLKTEVFADTIDSRLQYTKNGQTVNTSYVSVGTLMSFTKENPDIINFNRLFVRYTPTGGFEAGKSYFFMFQFNSPSVDLQVRCREGQLTVSSGATVTSSSCAFDGNVSYTFVATVSFDLAMSSVTLGVPANTLLPEAGATYNFRVTTASWNTSDDAANAINNQTDLFSVALQSINDILSSIYSTNDSILDEAETTSYYMGQLFVNVMDIFGSSEEYYTHYGGFVSTNVNGYSQAHSSGTSAGGSGVSGAESLTFDPTLYEDASETIWDFIYDFLSLNSKLLTYLTSILTLGFIKVVLNR